MNDLKLEELDKEILNRALLYSKNEEVSVFLKALEKINITTFFTKAIENHNLFLNYYKNINNYGGIGLKQSSHEVDPILISFLSEISAYISKADKWEEILKIIQELYLLNLNIDNCIGNKFKVNEFNQEMFGDRLYLLITYIRTLVTSINIIIGEKNNV